MADLTLKERVENHEYRLASLENSDVEQKEMLKTLIKVTMAVESLQKILSNIDQRVTCVEKEPGDRYKEIIRTVTTILIGIVLGCVAAVIGIKA